MALFAVSCVLPVDSSSLVLPRLGHTKLHSQDRHRSAHIRPSNRRTLIRAGLALTKEKVVDTGKVEFVHDRVADYSKGWTNAIAVAAAVTVGSLFVHTFTHALQMGAVTEVYRNCAGYYAAVERSIDQTLRLPVEQREDATIFQQKIAVLLGRRPAVTPMVPVGSKSAGVLF
ncbi:hypothetical protein AXG93_1953s1210 [Marchantia polymorpha subsp. ruderalis]|uniref:Uncharacterized protein n=1 Tax=Marchantia polymorpha subsp. ruderalis TaxID=1480154 RepID=A0A176VS77_MARPO|nr:hypothetical protein AXG93_1953s1210 [Marchantia polymorpha subsp. ruderalis]